MKFMKEIPAAFSILSNFTQFCNAMSTLSCITSLMLSTLADTEANLSTSFKLSYFLQIFGNKVAVCVFNEPSLAVRALSPTLAIN